MKHDIKYPNIALEIKKSGMTVAKVMSEIGYKTPRAYYAWQKGVGMPVVALIKLSELFNVSADYLISETQKQAN